MRVKIFACFLVVLAVTGAASAAPSPTAIRGTMDGFYDDNDCNNLNPGTTIDLGMTGQFVFGKVWRGSITLTLHRGCTPEYIPGPWDSEVTFDGVGLGQSSTAAGTCQVLSVDFVYPSAFVLGVGGTGSFGARLDCAGAVTNGKGTTPTGTFPIELEGVAFYAFDPCSAGFDLCGPGPQDTSGQILGVFSRG